MDCIPAGSSIHGILKAKILEWVAIAFSNAWKWKVKMKSLSCVWLFTIPWTCSLPGSSAHGIFQARALEWGAIAFSTMQETLVQFLGPEDPLEKGKANHSSILAWRIPWTIQSMGWQRVGHDWVTFTFTFSDTEVASMNDKLHWQLYMGLAWKIPWTEEPGGLQSIGSLRVGHNWATSLSLFTFMHWRRQWQPTPVFLPGKSQGRRSLVGCLYGVAQSWTQLKWLSSSSNVWLLQFINKMCYSLQKQTKQAVFLLGMAQFYLFVCFFAFMQIDNILIPDS